jgi:hypothetical protein
MLTGMHADYHWMDSEATLGCLLEVCPGIVIGRYLAITSYDSGALKVSDKDTADGWVSDGKVAYSPCVGSPLFAVCFSGGVLRDQ